MGGSGVSSYCARDSWVARIASLVPVWKDSGIFTTFPAATIFLAHARSASFAKDKGHIEYNQPYTREPYAFVFNGLLKGVTFPFPLAGQIGAQKIWSLYLQNAVDTPCARALELTVNQLRQHTQTVQALNIGVCDGEHFSVYCQYAAYPEYYGLRIAQNPELTVICSESLPGMTYHPLSPEEIYSL